MQHGIICSTPHLQDFAMLSDFHLILPHLFKDHPLYKVFYRDRVKAGDFVMMDNSFYELFEKGEEVDPNYLIQEANDINCSEVVAPEVFHDIPSSLKKLDSFMKLSDTEGSKIPISAVLQGNDLDELVSYFVKLANDYSSDISSISIPFALDFDHVKTRNIKSHTIRRVVNRWLLMESIADALDSQRCAIMPVHLLGLSDPLELQVYKDGRYDFIRSNDSSSAFIHGLMGIQITDRGLPCEKSKIKVDFNSEASPDKMQLIFENIEKIKSFL